MYDYEFKYGQNFYIALTEEAKELILNVSIRIVHTHTTCQYRQSDFSISWPKLGWPVACSLWNVSTFLACYAISHVTFVFGLRLQVSFGYHFK